MDFKLITKDHIPLLYQWLREPHVAKWWQDDAQLSIEDLSQKYRAKINDEFQEGFIVYVNNKPIGYIQWYDAIPSSKKEKLYGLDCFIGDSHYLGKGYGQKMTKSLIDLLYSKKGIKHFIVDPAHNNLRAIACYEKIGFEKVSSKDTTHGTLVIMKYEAS